MTEINVLTVNGTSYALRDEDAAQRLDSLENEVVINNTDRIEAEEAISEALQQEAQDRTAADTENLELAIENTAITKNEILAEVYGLTEAAAARLDALEQGYRHIATYEHTEDEGVKQIDITQDKDGNAFACSDFLFYLTLPTSDDINTNYKTQLYVGHKLWQDWDVFIAKGFSRTVTRRMRLHLYHAFDGYWVTDGVINDTPDSLDAYLYNDIATLPTTFGNIKSSGATGKTISELHLLAQSAFNKGTIIEIYGK